MASAKIKGARKGPIFMHLAARKLKVARNSENAFIPFLIKGIGLKFYNKLNEIAKAQKILSEIIINIDQTPLPFVQISKYTMEKKGSPRVSIPGTSDYHQMAETFTITMSGSSLHIKLTYQGKAEKVSSTTPFLVKFTSHKICIIGLTRKQTLK